MTIPSFAARQPVRLTNPFVLRVFTTAWRHRLYAPLGEHIVIVTGWRSALVDNRFGTRKHVTFCVKLFGRTVFD